MPYSNPKIRRAHDAFLHRRRRKLRSILTWTLLMDLWADHIPISTLLDLKRRF